MVLAWLPGLAAFPPECHLIVSTFVTKGSHFPELMGALATNLENPHVTTVHALHETAGRWYDNATGHLRDALTSAANDSLRTRPLSSAALAKLVVHFVFSQPSYRDFFRAAHMWVPHGSFALIANLDMAFGLSLRAALHAPGFHSLARPLMYVFSASTPALGSRYLEWFGEECATTPPRCFNWVDGGQSWPYAGSSIDAYLFRVPLPSTPVDLTDPQFTDQWGRGGLRMNQLHAEARVHKLLSTANVSLLNPCLFVPAENWHCRGGNDAVRWNNRASDHGWKIAEPCGTPHACQLSRHHITGTSAGHRTSG